MCGSVNVYYKNPYFHVAFSTNYIFDHIYSIFMRVCMAPPPPPIKKTKIKAITGSNMDTRRGGEIIGACSPLENPPHFFCYMGAYLLLFLHVEGVLATMLSLLGGLFETFLFIWGRGPFFSLPPLQKLLRAPMGSKHYAGRIDQGYKI